MKPGDILAERYRLTRLIGEGAMGVVWAAQHELTGAAVAVKLIQPDGAPRDLRDRLLREARACGRIRHRNVVEINDAGETENGEAFLVMQLLEGEPLSARLVEDGRLPVPLAIALGADIAAGLAAAHAAQVIHRDLKPDNVFLHRDADRPAPIVKLLDFGVSKLLRHDDVSSTATGSVLGSPAYMSPEQARADRSADHRTDIWSLGVVLFEMLAGRRPFEGETAFAVVAQILTIPIPALDEVVPDIDLRLVSLVARCLERDVARRIASADEVAAELRAIGQSLVAAPPLDDVADPPTPLSEESARWLEHKAAPVLASAHRAPEAPAVATISQVVALAPAATAPVEAQAPAATAPVEAQAPAATAPVEAQAPAARSGPWPAATMTPAPPPAGVTTTGPFTQSALVTQGPAYPASAAPLRAARPARATDRAGLIALAAGVSLLAAATAAGGWIWLQGARASAQPSPAALATQAETAPAPTPPGAPDATEAPAEATAPAVAASAEVVALVEAPIASASAAASARAPRPAALPAKPQKPAKHRPKLPADPG